MSYTVNLSIKQWAEEDRPREKLLIQGRSALTDAELVAILLGSGNRSMSALDLAKQLLSTVDNDLHSFGKLSAIELQKFNGIGQAKAITLLAALELGRRRKEFVFSPTPSITDSNGVYQFLEQDLMDLDHEEFWVVFLNRANVVIKKESFSSGGIAGTVVDTRLIFRKALEYLACSIVLAHNHPSGNLEPSKSDKVLTKKIKEAGLLMDITVLDHLIFTNHGYFSFADKSML